MNSQVPPPALTVDEPKPNQIEEVLETMPGLSMLCQCNGVATPPDDLLTSAGLYLINKSPGDPAPSDAELFSSPDSTQPDEGDEWRWNYDEFLMVNGEVAPTANNNELHVGAIWVDWSDPDLPPQVDRAAIQFKGKIDDCPTMAASKKAAAAAAKQLASSIPTPSREASPSKVDGGWLGYQQLAVDRLYSGNLLLKGGVPLSARRIAVAAFDVFWEYGNGNLVTRPLGEISASGVGWFFKGAPEASIVIWQGYKPDRHVVSSVCRNSPDLVDLDPGKPVYVQVNFGLPHILRRRGGFGLWVQIVD